jgi:hypothetical protein
MANCGRDVVGFPHLCLRTTLICRRDILAELASVGQLTLTHSLSNYNATIGTEYEHRQQNDHAGFTTAGSGAPFGAQHAPVTPSGMDSRSPGTIAPEYMMEASTFVSSPTPDTWFLADNTLADMYKDPAQATSELGDMIDRETVAMWSAPMGLQYVVFVPVSPSIV